MRIRSFRRVRSEEKGQSLVEMALVCLLFFFLLFGVLEFGRALWSYNTIAQTTRQAARWAVVNVQSNTDTSNVNRTKNIVIYGYPEVTSGTPLLPGLNTATINVSVQALQSDSNGVPITQKISVSVSNYRFHFIVPIAPTLTIPAYETTLYTESMGVFPG